MHKLRLEKGWTHDQYVRSTRDISIATVTRIPAAPNLRTLGRLAEPFGLPGWVLLIADDETFAQVRELLGEKSGQEVE